MKDETTFDGTFDVWSDGVIKQPRRMDSSRLKNDTAYLNAWSKFIRKQRIVSRKQRLPKCLSCGGEAQEFVYGSYILFHDESCPDNNIIENYRAKPL